MRFRLLGLTPLCKLGVTHFFRCFLTSGFDSGNELLDVAHELGEFFLRHGGCFPALLYFCNQGVVKRIQLDKTLGTVLGGTP